MGWHFHFRLGRGFAAFPGNLHGDGAGRGGGPADGREVLLAGCDSSTNTFDKLFPDGKETFLKWFDVCTIHYQGSPRPFSIRRG